MTSLHMAMFFVCLFVLLTKAYQDLHGGAGVKNPPSKQVQSLVRGPKITHMLLDN